MSSPSAYFFTLSSGIEVMAEQPVEIIKRKKTGKIKQPLKYPGIARFGEKNYFFGGFGGFPPPPPFPPTVTSTSLE